MTQRKDNQLTSKETLDSMAPLRMWPTESLGSYHELVMNSHKERGSHSGNRNQVKDSSCDTKCGEGEIERGSLAQGVRSECEDNESEDIGHP